MRTPTALLLLRLDAEGRYVFVSDAAAEAAGRPRDAMLGRTAREAGFPGEVVAATEAAVAHVFATGTPCSQRFAYPCPAGIRHFESHAEPERAEDGQVRSALVAVVEVTAEADAEVRLAQEQEVLSATFEQMDEEVVICDADGRILLLNDTARRLHAVDAAGTQPTLEEEGAWFRHRDGVTPMAPEDLPLRRALAGASVPPMEVVLAKPGRSPRHLLARARQLRRPDGSVLGAVLVARDVTGERALEEKLQRAQRLESAGRLAAGVSHEFNSLFTAVQFAVELADDDLRAGRDARWHLQEIGEVMRRAQHLTTELTSFCRGLPSAARPFRLGAWLAQAEKAVRRLLPPEVRLVVEAATEDVDWVRMDPVQLEHALHHLAENARDAMPGGGTLVVRRGAVQLEQPLTHPTGTLPAGRYATLEVADSGVGMDETTLRHLFEPFFSTKPWVTGRGLGLSTVHGIVGQVGGGITVESTPGRGTRLTLYLPAVERPTPMAIPPAAPAAGARKGPILLVDDDESLLRVLARGLEREGRRVLRAGGVAEALVQAVAASEPIGLILTDMHMPDGSGMDVVQRLMESGVRAPVLIMTGYADVDVPAEWLGNPGFRFLTKPFTLLELSTAIDALCAPGAPVVAGTASTPSD